MNIRGGTVLKVVKTLYVIPESSLHWYLTNLDRHLTRLEMLRSLVDPCVIVKRNERDICGGVIIQVDDSLGTGTHESLTQEEYAAQHSKHKPRTILGTQPVCFNVLGVTKHANGTLYLGQSEKH